MTTGRRRTTWPGVLGLALLWAAPAAADPGPLLARIKAVKAEGAGNAEAARAWKELVALGPDALLPTLAALDGADATAANWLYAAADAIAERELAAGRPLPAAKLEAFVLDQARHPRARRLAYEWLCRADPKAPARLLPGMLQDPSVELRRDAVAVALQEAERLQDKDAATAAYRKALSGARDKDQVELAVKQLKSLGVEVDVAAHFGFIRTWQLAAPFDNTGEKGFAAAFAPEKGVDLKAKYQGKKDAEVTWKEYTTADPYGIVDLNKAVGKHMGVTGYAFAVVHSSKEQPVQVRVGCINAVKVFVNGKQVLAHEEYHHGMSMDQYAGTATLQAGRNEVLVKVCQNEQTEVWAQEWKFQLRLCDAVGGAVPFTLGAEGKVGR